jgi:hypothetical protein
MDVMDFDFEFYCQITERIEELKKVRADKPVETQIAVNQAILDKFFRRFNPDRKKLIRPLKSPEII